MEYFTRVDSTIFLAEGNINLTSAIQGHLPPLTVKEKLFDLDFL